MKFIIAHKNKKIGFLFYQTAAQDSLSFIKNNALTGAYCSLRFGKFN